MCVLSIQSVEKLVAVFLGKVDIFNLINHAFSTCYFEDDLLLPLSLFLISDVSLL